MAEVDRSAARIAAASEIWFAFSAWLRILEDTEGGLWAGRELTLEDGGARETTVAAIEASPWQDDLAEILEAFDNASGFVADWTTVGEAPRGRVAPISGSL